MELVTETLELNPRPHRHGGFASELVKALPHQETPPRNAHGSLTARRAGGWPQRYDLGGSNCEEGRD